MSLRINIVTLGVTDVAASRDFYEALGFAASSASQPEIVFFQVGPVVMALFAKDSLAEDAQLPHGHGRAGAVSLACNLESESAVDALLGKAQKIGATILKPPQKVFWGGYSGYFADPDGHPWEVAYNPHFTIDANGAVQLP
ncbi:MAG: Glyoxalase/bleomycin resistance protein/dioxygenase [Rhodospirillales bacterium]|nr:Glyoxalase/bleomycin resistance protein/dioxygenase [Rhodospirillales bacterium]